MNIKVTIIGSGQAAAPVPTPVGGQGASGGFKPTAMPGTSMPSPAPASIRPTVIGPTALPSTQPVPAPEPVSAKHFAPTALEPSAPAAVQPTHPVRPSALPGEQRKALEVSMAELVRRFPSEAATSLQRAQGVLAGVSPGHMNSASWLNFGKDAQEALATLVKHRLALAQDPQVRTVTQHLSRLQALLTEILEAFEGGWMRKSPERVWASNEKEIRQLEGLLDTADDALTRHLSELEGLKAPAQTCGHQLEATTLAAEYLADVVQADTGGLLVARHTSLVGSQALLKEHLMFLEAAITQVKELATLVQDGVLLKLTAVYSQLSGLTGHTTETQRFQATERLTDILHSLNQRKNP